MTRWNPSSLFDHMTEAWMRYGAYAMVPAGYTPGPDIHIQVTTRKGTPILNSLRGDLMRHMGFMHPTKLPFSSLHNGQWRHFFYLATPLVKDGLFTCVGVEVLAPTLSSTDQVRALVYQEPSFKSAKEEQVSIFRPDIVRRYQALGMDDIARLKSGA